MPELVPELQWTPCTPFGKYIFINKVCFPPHSVFLNCDLFRNLQSLSYSHFVHTLILLQYFWVLGSLHGRSGSSLWHHPQDPPHTLQDPSQPQPECTNRNHIIWLLMDLFITLQSSQTKPSPVTCEIKVWKMILEVAKLMPYLYLPDISNKVLHFFILLESLQAL